MADKHSQRENIFVDPERTLSFIRFRNHHFLVWTRYVPSDNIMNPRLSLESLN
jgi:hypothetical protein